jgi:aspartate ammonia-lyase
MRLEHDLLGDREVCADAYFGIHTLRATENFPITGIPVAAHPDLVVALAAIKQAAALTNAELGLLDSDRADAIIVACEEIRSGALHDQFVVDVIQGGAGTSTNMNANEVVANRALELLGHAKGDYGRLHPLDHVNLSQSTNDVYPTAIKLGLQAALDRLRESMSLLSNTFADKAADFATVVKVGRTQLQDAVPMTLGQEIATFAIMIGEDSQRLGEAAELITEINLGGTAIGTGLNAHPDYSQRVRHNLAALTGINMTIASDLIEATQDVGAFVQLSGVLKRTAVKLSKVCNDLRLLSSGPRAGFGEITLPAVQAGSSIMPGKVNPVIPEVVNQIAYRVVGNDLTITMAAEAGQLQLNAFEPIIAHCLFETIELLDRGCRVLADRCVSGIGANVERMRDMVEASIGVVTALNPHIGYVAASSIAADALSSGRNVTALVLERRLLSTEQLDRIMLPQNLTRSTALVATDAQAVVPSGAPGLGGEQM